MAAAGAGNPVGAVCLGVCRAPSLRSQACLLLDGIMSVSMLNLQQEVMCNDFCSMDKQ